MSALSFFSISFSKSLRSYRGVFNPGSITGKRSLCSFRKSLYLYPAVWPNPSSLAASPFFSRRVFFVSLFFMWCTIAQQKIKKRKNFKKLTLNLAFTFLAFFISKTWLRRKKLKCGGKTKRLSALRGSDQSSRSFLMTGSLPPGGLVAGPRLYLATMTEKKPTWLN